jgi:hypothetical protein
MAMGGSRFLKLCRVGARRPSRSSPSRFEADDGGRIVIGASSRTLRLPPSRSRRPSEMRTQRRP